MNLNRVVENDLVNWIDLLGLREEYASPEEAISKCGEKAKQKALDDVATKKEKNKKGGHFATQEREWGGLVCRAKCLKKDDPPKYYCTEQKEGDTSGVQAKKMTPCDKDDAYEGFYHSHPHNTGLSPEDIRKHTHGWGDNVPEANKRKGKPVGATRKVGDNFVTDIVPWPRMPVTTGGK